MHFDFAKLNEILSLITQYGSALTQYGIIQYGITATGMTICFCLLLLAKREIKTVRSALTESREAADAGLRKLSDSLEEVRNVLNADPEPVLPQNALSLNLTKRTQALRMHRRGETMASIAAALQAPMSEIELLLKLARILDSRPQ